MKRNEQLLPENLWYQRMGRTRGHIADYRGLEERDGDKGEHAWFGRKGKLQRSSKGPMYTPTLSYSILIIVHNRCISNLIKKQF